MERLDKALGNDSWCDLFPNHSIFHLPKTHSDHSPILVELIPKRRGHHNQPFRLETFWCKHPDFFNVVNKTRLIQTILQLVIPSSKMLKSGNTKHLVI